MSFIKRVSATTIASELVSVTPLSAPPGVKFHIHRMDVNLKEKIPAITERIEKIK